MIYSSLQGAGLVDVAGKTSGSGVWTCELANSKAWGSDPVLMKWLHCANSHHLQGWHNLYDPLQVVGVN